MNNLFISDYERAHPVKYKLGVCFLRLMKHHELRFLFWGRYEQTCSNKVGRKFAKFILHKYRRKYGLEINFRNVGEGLRLIHPWNITINANAVLGANVTLYKGCTVGEITQGHRKGNPIIEENVVVYANATICGNVRVGANSVIAPGAFVNFDVPQNAIVIGNPGVIHYRNKT